MNKIVLGLITLVALAGCSAMGNGDAPGPTADKGGAAMNNQAAEDAINSAPPELRDRIRQEREKSMQQSGPPPKK